MQVAAACSALYRIDEEIKHLRPINRVTQRVGSTYAKGRHGKNRTEGISPAETSDADLKT
jgi:hypothetical protein